LPLVEFPAVSFLVVFLGFTAVAPHFAGFLATVDLGDHWEAGGGKAIKPPPAEGHEV